MQKVDAKNVRIVEVASGADGSPAVRRRVPRRSMHQRVGILIAGQYQLGEALEIGEGGVLISGPTDLLKDQRVVITIRIPGILSGVILGHVVYIIQPTDSQTARFGIEFDQISFELKRKIRLFVASSNTTFSARPLAS